MNPKLLPFFAILAIALIAATIILVFRSPGAPITSGAETAADPVDPMREEMACIDRVLQNRNMQSEEVQPALDRCRGSTGRSEENLAQ